MQTGTALTVRYWIASDSPTFHDLEGIESFRSALAVDYVSIVKGRAAGAGGLTHLYVDLISTLSLSHLCQLLLDGIAFDLIKHGTEAFVLRPFLAAYRSLQERNRKRGTIDIAELKVQFQDSILIIHEISADTIVDNLEKILLTLAQNYEHLVRVNGEAPFAIHIPVLEDPEEDRPCRFRIIGDIDETIGSKDSKDYFNFWGIEYDRYPSIQVYDVQKKLLIDDNFHTLEQHWAALTKKAE